VFWRTPIILRRVRWLADGKLCCFLSRRVSSILRVGVGTTCFAPQSAVSPRGLVRRTEPSVPGGWSTVVIPLRILFQTCNPLQILTPVSHQTWISCTIPAFKEGLATSYMQLEQNRGVILSSCNRKTLERTRHAFSGWKSPESSCLTFPTPPYELWQKVRFPLLHFEKNRDDETCLSAVNTWGVILNSSIHSPHVRAYQN